VRRTMGPSEERELIWPTLAADRDPSVTSIVEASQAPAAA
jgi:hypothetical protein